VLGQVKLALHFQIPPQASLHGIVKTHRSSAERMALLRFARESLGENRGLCLACQQGDVLRKHPQACLRVSFPKQIQHSRSESTPCFLILFIRVYLCNPWLKFSTCEF
jgi:hypothetical protein